jgi:hypothetical protein
MRRRHILVATISAFITAGCGSSNTGTTSDPGSPPPGASDAVERYVEALNDRDTKALLAVGAAPDEPWSRDQADRIIKSKGGKGLTITKAPIEYDRMGDYMGRAALATSDKDGQPIRESVDLMHEHNRWHVVLFEWPSGDKATSAP